MSCSCDKEFLLLKSSEDAGTPKLNANVAIITFTGTSLGAEMTTGFVHLYILHLGGRSITKVNSGYM